MDIVSRSRLLLFTGSANPGLATEVADLLGAPLGKLEHSVFANGEIYVRPTQSVRGADCFVLQSHCHPINEHIMEQLLTIDALTARIRPSHNGRHALLRICPSGQEGASSRADLRPSHG